MDFPISHASAQYYSQYFYQDPFLFFIRQTLRKNLFQGLIEFSPETGHHLPAHDCIQVSAPFPPRPIVEILTDGSWGQFFPVEIMEVS